MKLVELRIQQYQSHLDSTIKFNDGLNIIVGPSDSGKSSIIRALKKLIRDTPAGKGFITNGKTECEISLVFEFEGQLHKVVRKITSSKNLYYLDTKEFGGFGREIPLEVQTALDMSLLDLENGDYVDLHFTSQHDHPFLLGDAASHRSRVLGRLTGLHVLDKAIVNCNSQVKQVSQRRDALKDSKKELDRELASLPDVVELEEELQLRTTSLTKIKKSATELVKLQSLKSQLVSIVSQGKAVLDELAKIPSNIPTTDEVSPITLDAEGVSFSIEPITLL
jgi:exonuclease SbcC